MGGDTLAASRATKAMGLNTNRVIPRRAFQSNDADVEQAVEPNFGERRSCEISNQSFHPLAIALGTEVVAWTVRPPGSASRVGRPPLVGGRVG